MTSMPVAARSGAVAGLVGGFASGLPLGQAGILPAVAVNASAAAGLTVHLVSCVVLGVLFGLLLRRTSAEPGQTVFWGLTYGIIWWYAGALTLVPLLSGAPLGWGIEAAAAAVPMLLADLIFGLLTAVTFTLLRQPPSMPDWRASVRRFVAVLVRGVGSGIAATAVLAAGLGTVFTSITSNATTLVVLGAVTGASYAVLYPNSPHATGPAAARGAALGFGIWIAGPLTLIPALTGHMLPWTVEQVRDLFPALPGCILLGATAAVIGGWLSGLRRLLFADPSERADEESLGTRTGQALVRGAAGGIAGGLVFTVIMAQIGYLGTVARLTGSSQAGTGLAIHLLISVVLGSSYGLFFRQQSDDLSSGAGWGICWGLLWWILGALTLLPLWSGETPQWTASAAAAAFPSLIGHLGYGAALGAIFSALEARYSPWWTRDDVPATIQANLSRRRLQLATSAPAVWASVTLVAVTLTIVLSP